MALCPTRRRAVAVGGLVLLLIGLSVLIPAPVHAQETPLDPPPSVEEILKAIIDELFKVKPTELNGDFLQWLIALPDFVGAPGNGAIDGDLANLGNTTTAIAFGVLTAVATWAVVHYWLSGISFLRSSGVELLEGITRSVGVALLIIGWPLIFANAVALVNSISAALVDRPGLDRLAEMLKSAMGSEDLFQEGVAMILGVVISIATIVLVLGLAITKVVMSVALAVLFVWMPIAFVIWPVPSLAFITQASIRVLISLLAMQVLWAACLATFLAVGQKILDWGARGSVFVDGIARPFVAIALLTTMMMVTRLILRLNVSSGGMGMGGGGIAHLAAPLASVVSTAAGAPTGGPPGSGIGPEFGAPGNETTTQQPVQEPTVRENSFERGGPAGPQGGTGNESAGARTVAMPTGGSVPTGTTAPGAAAPAPAAGARANATASREATAPAIGATSGAAAGRPGGAEQAAPAQATGAGKAGEPGQAGQGQVRPPDEQPATGGGGGPRINTVGEQAPGATARPADAAAGSSSGAAPHSDNPGGGVAPAPGSQPAEQPGSAGPRGERGSDGADALRATGSGTPDAQPAGQPNPSSAGGNTGSGADDAAAGTAGAGGEAPSQPAPSSGGPGQLGGPAGPGLAGPAAGPGDARSGDARDGTSALSYDWVAGEFRPSSLEPVASDEAADSPSTETDDVGDVSYTGILEAGDGDGSDERGS